MPYGYGGYGRSSSYRYNFGNSRSSYYTSPWSSDYYYGRSRRRPYYWERDYNSYYNRSRNVRDSPEPIPEPEPPKPEPKPEEILKLIKVEDVDFNVKENTKQHRTDDFECTEAGNAEPELVVRRGDFMKFKITFDQPYDKEKHDLKMTFTIGKSPSESKGSMAQFKIDEDGKTSYDPKEWGAYLESRSGNDINVMVHIAANCIVGEWNLKLKTLIEGHEKDKTLVYTYEHPEDVTILFNPWCKDDGVYMKDQDLLDEYILSEDGAVYTGSWKNIGSRPWNFGQFEEGVLDVCLHLLRKGFPNGVSKKMADPVHVARIIVKMVNSSDDQGVLVGNWSGDYSGGISPTVWVGSPKILKKFMKNGPVKYGQCWVFSCLTTTVCRCLGIPCRSVTNFSSAHDSDKSNLIETVVDEDNKKIPGFSDSVWNFHVWNEAWLARDDLGEKGFDGWQAIDATPQETSESVYTCGPCPVIAIKQGRVDLKYDASFVFSEVNADRARYVYKKAEDTYELISLEKHSIGKSISTKVAHRYGREDLTHQYKHPEGSEEERVSVHKAFEIAKNANERPSWMPIFDPYKETSDVKKVSVELNFSNEIMIGSDFPLEITVKNPTERLQSLMNIHLSISAKSYTGVTRDSFYDRYGYDIQIEPEQDITFKLVLTTEEYFSHLLEQYSIDIDVSGEVGSPGASEAHTGLSVSEDFRFRRPELEVKGPDSGEIEKEVTFTVSFKNPLHIPLTNCSMSMGSSGFRDIEDQPQPNVGPGEMYSKRFNMTPKRAKKRDVLFTFESDELKDITGSTSIVISLAE